MKKFKKFLAVISAAAAAAVSLSAMPASADFETYSYLDDPENIVWEDYGMKAYNNNRIYAEMYKQTNVCFTPVNGNSSDFPGLPGKYTVDISPLDYSTKAIRVQNQEELDEVTAIVKNWAGRNIVKQPYTQNLYTYCYGFIEAKISVKNDEDLEAVKADYPECIMSEAAFKDAPYKGYYVSFQKDDTSKIPEILNALESDSRIEQCTVTAANQLLLYTNPDTMNPIEYKLRGDISGNFEIDLYDAIEIAKSLVSGKVFTEEEMEIADYNEDGKVDLYDAIRIAEYIIKNK